VFSELISSKYKFGHFIYKIYYVVNNPGSLYHSHIILGSVEVMTLCQYRAPALDTLFLNALDVISVLL
jgi:hypothetical protein